MISGPIFASDPNADLLRRVIEAANGYERLCGFRPTCLHVNGPIRSALKSKGFNIGTVIAGMKLIASPESIADMAICSRDEDLFKIFAPIVEIKSVPNVSRDVEIKSVPKRSRK